MAADDRAEVVSQLLIDRVSLSYAGTKLAAPLPALRDVTLRIERGEFICVIGPSGCGKSTLLSAIAGHLSEYEGKILVEGNPASGPGRDRVMVFQQPTLFPWYTVTENVAFGLKLRAARVSGQNIDGEVRNYLSLVGLESFGDLYPFALSGGMRQRVDIARALAVVPQILLMDEPFGALDALTRLNMQREMERIWKQTGKTVLFVTHDIGEAIILADRVVVMSPRPATVKEDIPIELPRPRHREDSGVLKLARHIAQLLEVSF